MKKKMIIFDLNDPAQAREYIQSLRIEGKAITYIDTTGGRRVYVKDMDNDEVREFASQLYELQTLAEHSGTLQ